MSHHTTSFNSLGGGHTYTHVNFLDNNNFKKLGNSGVELNLVVDEINCVLLNFIPPTSNTCIKNSKCLYFNIEAHF